MKPKISLCIISGNEERTIVRMLESFRDCFDELSLVIATGATPADATGNRARAWCEDNGKSVAIEHHFNAPDCEKWPHVDDFAAARNKAFAQAWGDWLLWADCDDVFTGDARELRSIAESNTADVHHFGYDVANAGKLVSRERLIRSHAHDSGAMWVGAIHENYRALSHHTHKRHDLTWWRHDPIADRPPSSDRNLRILANQLSSAPANAFYVHHDYFLRGDKAKAQKWGDIFLSFPVSDASLRYQAHLNLSAIAATHAEASRHALAAYWLFPYREALAALVNCAFQEHDGNKALHFAIMLQETSKPKEPLWCHEPRWHGWHGQDLLSRAQRLKYGEAHADAINHKPSILLIHESSTQDDNAIQARDLWMTTAFAPEAIRHIFELPDDEIENKWFLSFERCAQSKIGDVIDQYPPKATTVKRIDSNMIPEPSWDLQLTLK